MTKLQVYIATYNRSGFLEQTIKSVLAQTYSDFNLLILDNHSTDHTKEVVDKYRALDKRIDYFCQKQNVGGIENLNTAMTRINGEYFCVLHDDDLCHPTLFEEEIRFLDSNKDCAAVSCLSEQINEKGIISRKCPEVEKIKTFKGCDFFKNYLANQESLVFPPTMYRTAFIAKNKLSIRKDVGPCCDVVFFMDIEKNGGTLAQLNRNLFSYRVYSEQDSSSHLESMLIELIAFIKKDSYYGYLFSQMKKEQKKYYWWYTKKLVIRTASKRIKVREASSYLNEMSNLIDCGLFLCLASKIIINCERIIPAFFEFIYKKGTERRGNNL